MSKPYRVIKFGFRNKETGKMHIITVRLTDLILFVTLIVVTTTIIVVAT